MTNDPATRVTEEIRSLVEQLTRGFNEHVDYVVDLHGTRHARTAIRHYEGLLTQLEANSTMPLQSRAQGSGGGGKPKSRPPLNTVYSDMRDTIHEGALTAWVLLYEDRAWPIALPALLEELQRGVALNCGDSFYECATIAGMARKWVHDARVLLGYESRKVVLADTVCGECGGALMVAVDATSDVRCAGTPATESCGTVYGRLEWISLLQSGE